MTEPIDAQALCDLRLELNQQQQVRAALELELRQREETVIKLQAEQQKRESAHQEALKALKSRLEAAEAKGAPTDGSGIKDEATELDRLRSKDKESAERINTLLEKQSTFEKIMNEYEKALTNKMNEIEKIKSENETAKRHLANLEMAFSDVHQKYERTKQLIEGYRTNEEMLQQGLINSTEVAKKNEEKYDSLKAHAKAQIDRSNRELLSYREKHQAEVTKLSTIIKRLEIKNASLVQALDQKTTECSELAALCNEVTGRID